MKRRLFTTILILVTTLLNSCNQKEIRSDIAEFIASFSVEEAVEAYKKTKMEKVQNIDDGENITKITQTIVFDVSDANNPLYESVTKTYVNEELTTTSSLFLKQENGNYYIVLNGQESLSTLEKNHEIVREFFYKDVYLDGTYHEGGYYYGDMIRGSIEDYQNFITVDNENATLTFSRCVNQTSNGVDVKRCSRFILDNLGMMLYNLASAEGDNKLSTTEIIIKKN